MNKYICVNLPCKKVNTHGWLCRGCHEELGEDYEIRKILITLMSNESRLEALEAKNSDLKRELIRLVNLPHLGGDEE